MDPHHIYGQEVRQHDSLAVCYFCNITYDCEDKAHEKVLGFYFTFFVCFTCNVLSVIGN